MNKNRYFLGVTHEKTEKIQDSAETNVIIYHINRENCQKIDLSCSGLENACKEELKKIDLYYSKQTVDI